MYNFRKDSEWGREAELRAIEVLKSRNWEVLDVAHYGLHYDIIAIKDTTNYRIDVKRQKIIAEGYIIVEVDGWLQNEDVDIYMFTLNDTFYAISASQLKEEVEIGNYERIKKGGKYTICYVPIENLKKYNTYQELY